MLKGLNVGRLDLLITIESPTLAANSIGENETTWATYKQAFSSRTWEGGSEGFENRQEVGTDRVKFIIRYDAGVTSLMRLKEESDTTYFYVKGVNQWRREGYTQIIAERRDNQ
jgi:head-tail adaptor